MIWPVFQVESSSLGMETNDTGDDEFRQAFDTQRREVTANEELRSAFKQAFDTLRREVTTNEELRSVMDYLKGILSLAMSCKGSVTLEVTNPEFSSRVWRYSGAMFLLSLAGWIETVNHQLVLTRSDDKLSKLQEFLFRNRMAKVFSPNELDYKFRSMRLSSSGLWEAVTIKPITLPDMNFESEKERNESKKEVRKKE